MVEQIKCQGKFCDLSIHESFDLPCGNNAVYSATSSYSVSKQEEMFF